MDFKIGAQVGIKSVDMSKSVQTREINFTAENSALKSIAYGTDQSVILKTETGNLEFSLIGKKEFTSQGEKVIELSGLATDGKEDKSWAIAYFEPGSSSPTHYHKERTEIYYVTAGTAKLSIDDNVYELKAGDSQVILRRQKHQITNLDHKETLEVMVDCTPAWVYTDHHIEPDQNGLPDVETSAGGADLSTADTLKTYDMQVYGSRAKITQTGEPTLYLDLLPNSTMNLVSAGIQTQIETQDRKITTNTVVSGGDINAVSTTISPGFSGVTNRTVVSGAKVKTISSKIGL